MPRHIDPAASHSAPIDRGLVDAIARRVVELLREDPILATRPLTVGEVAGMVGKSHEWVRDHRQELGLIEREGARPRLMFDPIRVREALTARSGSERSRGGEKPDQEPKPRPRRRRPMGTGAPLLPIRGGS